MNEIDRNHCVVPELPECLRESCLYFDEDLRECIRGSLKMTAKQREAWRAKRRAEVAELAGGIHER